MSEEKELVKSLKSAIKENTNLLDTCINFIARLLGILAGKGGEAELERQINY